MGDSSDRTSRRGVARRVDRPRYAPLAPLVVDDVSVEIEAGAFLAIVGRSGSGKSTLGRLLLGLYPPETGRVLLDGIDLTELDAVTVRSQIGVVTQDPYILWAHRTREHRHFRPRPYRSSG